jgi:hypothetical protein
LASESELLLVLLSECELQSVLLLALQLQWLSPSQWLLPLQSL